MQGSSAIPATELLQWLRSPNAEDRDDALAMLADKCGESYGDDGQDLGRVLRDKRLNGIGLLCGLLRDEDVEVKQQTLLIIGNMCSDSVDCESVLTKRMLLTYSAEGPLFDCLGTTDETTLMLACGALQNLCHDRDWSELLARKEAHTVLESLLGHPSALVVRYASGALQNMMATLQSDTPSYSAHAADAVRQRSLLADVEEFSYRRAAAAITRGVGRMSAGKRLQRVLSGQAKRAAESAKLPPSDRRRAAPLSRVSRAGGSGQVPPGSPGSSSQRSPPGSERSSERGSSASGSTTYYSVASHSCSQASKGSNPGGSSGACFEV